MEPLEALMGRVSQRLRKREDDKWGLFLRVIENKDAKESMRFREVASKAYGTHRVWLAFKRRIDVGKTPIVLRVTGDACSSCHVSVPLNARQNLKRGRPSCALGVGRLPCSGRSKVSLLAPG